MSIFFEIADISYELENIDMEQVTSDVIQFFTKQRTEGYTHILCHVDFVEDYSPLSGDVLLQDPFRIVLNKDGREKRIFFLTPFENIYGVYHEISENEIRVETHRKIIDMHFLELLTFEKYLLRNQAFILHSCYVAYDGVGMALTAPSGTGKSTQGNLWEKYGDGEVINGDRSILQRKNGKWYIHSLPFCGSSFTNKNQSYELKSVVIVNRSPDNYTETFDFDRDYPRVLNEITVNKWDRDAADQIVKLGKILFDEGKVINLFCNMEPEACYCLKESLYHD